MEHDPSAAPGGDQGHLHEGELHNESLRVNSGNHIYIIRVRELRTAGTAVRVLEKVRFSAVLALLETSLIEDAQTASLNIDIAGADHLAARIDLARHIGVHVTVLTEIEFSDLVIQETDLLVLLRDRSLIDGPAPDISYTRTSACSCRR